MSNTTTSAGERLVIRRTFAAKRERIWQAFTDAEEAMQWSHPENMSTKEFTADLRVGGAFRLTMVKPDGEEYSAKGIYREITPPEKLVYTWTWEEDTPQEEHETLLTIELRALGDDTELTLTHENLKSVESRDGHEVGWNEFLNNLGSHLASMS